MDDTDLIAKLGKKKYRRRHERERYHTQSIDLSRGGSAMLDKGATDKLAQDIRDEFLTCKICLQPFRSPKSLSCLHTFCQLCIEKHVQAESSYNKYSDYREFTCPLCRKRVQLPAGGVKRLPDNILVSSLSEIVSRQQPAKTFFCDICTQLKQQQREASCRCLHCDKLLCPACVQQHRGTKVTQDHDLCDVSTEKDIACKIHQDEVVRFYCEPCQTCVCVLCTFTEHKDHDITQFSEAVMRHRQDMEGLLAACKTKAAAFHQQLLQLDQCHAFIHTATQRIHDVASQFIADIRAREKQLVQELHALYGTELMEYITRKQQMLDKLQSLKNTCSLTELVLQSNDMELLLLKRQVQDKLGYLAMATLHDLPRTAHRHVAFLPGTVDLGVLQDNALPPVLRLHKQVSVPADLTDATLVRAAGTQVEMTSPVPQRRVSRHVQTQRSSRRASGGDVTRGSEAAPDKTTVATGTDTASTADVGITAQ